MNQLLAKYKLTEEDLEVLLPIEPLIKAREKERYCRRVKQEAEMRMLSIEDLKEINYWRDKKLARVEKNRELERLSQNMERMWFNSVMKDKIASEHTTKRVIKLEEELKTIKENPLWN